MSSPETSSRISALESRLASLETQASYLSSRIDRAEGKIDIFSERITRIEERVAHLPTKELVVKIALGTIAALGSILTFQGQIKKLLGF